MYLIVNLTSPAIPGGGCECTNSFKKATIKYLITFKEYILQKKDSENVDNNSKVGRERLKEMQAYRPILYTVRTYACMLTQVYMCVYARAYIHKLSYALGNTIHAQYNTGVPYLLCTLLEKNICIRIALMY